MLMKSPARHPCCCTSTGVADACCIDDVIPPHRYADLDGAEALGHERLYAFSNGAEILEGPHVRTIAADGDSDMTIVKVLMKVRFEQHFNMRAFPCDQHMLHIQLTSNIPTIIPGINSSTNPGTSASSDGSSSSSTKGRARKTRSQKAASPPAAPITLQFVKDPDKPCVSQAHHYFMERDIWKIKDYLVKTRD